MQIPLTFEEFQQRQLLFLSPNLNIKIIPTEKDRGLRSNKYTFVNPSVLVSQLWLSEFSMGTTLIHSELVSRTKNSASSMKSLRSLHIELDDCAVRDVFWWIPCISAVVAFFRNFKSIIENPQADRDGITHDQPDEWCLIVIETPHHEHPKP